MKLKNLIGFIDNNLSFQGQTFCGLPVYAPDFTKIKPNVIVICVRGWGRQIWADHAS